MALAERHLQAYQVNNGGEPQWNQIQDYHNEEYDNFGLDADDWFPNKMLNESTDPEGLWNDWQFNDSPLDVWEDAIHVANAGGDLLFGPELLRQALSTDGIDPGQNEFAKNLANALANLDPAGREGLAKDLLGELYELPSDYNWAFQNPRAIGSEILDGFSSAAEYVTGVIAKFFLGENTLSPLVFDLDGDGIELASLTGPDAVYWDIDVDGFAEASGWVDGDDGLLAIDVNQDGVINDHSELFGNGAGFQNGFLALAAYDSNGDGLITSDDDDWDRLIIWQDANGDGVSQSDEMMSLNDWNITAIDLKAVNDNYQIRSIAA